MKSLLLLALVFCLLLTAPAYAQLVEPLIGSAIGAGAELSAAAQKPMSRETILLRLKQQGYANVAPKSSNPMTFSATTAAGMPVEITVEPKTGQILSILPR